MIRGKTEFLNPKTPNLDLWRKLHAAILDRGGMRENRADDDNFTIIWQPSHTRATVDETACMKHLRRGNDAADYFANLGRAMHPSVSELVITTQARYRAAKNWMTWIAKAAALQYDSAFGKCDHYLRDKTRCKMKGADQKYLMRPKY